MSHGEYLEIKERILASDYRRITRPISALEVVSEQTIALKDPSHGELQFAMTGAAFTSLLHLLKLDTKSHKTMDKALGKDMANKVIRMVSEQAGASGSLQEVTLLIKPDLANPSESKVIYFTTQTSPVATAHDYIRELEKIMNDNPNMVLRSLNMDGSGNVKATMLNPKWGFEIAGMKHEEHNSGIHFSMSGKGLAVNPYAMRLICTNGMVGAKTLAHFALTTSNPVHRDRFLKALEDISQMRFFEQEFIEKAQMMNQTRASLSEMEQAYNIASRHIDVTALSALADVNQEIPWLAVKELYREQGYDLEKLPRQVKSTLKSNMSLWEVVNALTFLGSNRGDQNDDLLEAAGRFMGRGDAKAKWGGGFDLGGSIPELY